MRGPRPLVVGAFVTALIVATVGCGGLPVSHGVHRVRAIAANAPADTNVRLIPPPPQPGAGPTAIVTGFLRAAASDVVRARQYLVPDPVWVEGAPVRVYSDAALVPRAVGSAPATTGHVATSTVAVTLTPVANLNPSGALVATAGTATTETFTLAELPEVGWRISEAPPGLALSISDLRSRAQIPLTLFAPGGDVTVRTAVLLDPGADLATTAVDALLATQPAGLRTYVPAGTALNDVSVSAATIVVDLTARAATVSGDDLRKLGVQLAATLLPVEPDATGVRIDVGGRPLEGSGRYTMADVDAYDPELSTSTGDPVVVDARGAHMTLLPGAGSADHGPAVPAAVSVDGRKAAWVRGRRVVIASTDTLDQATPVTSAGTWRSLSWGRDGSLWLVRDSRDTTAAPGTNIAVVSPGATAAAPVALPAGLPGPVSELRVARDGVEAVIVAGGQLSRVTVGPDASGLGLHAAVPIARDLTGVTVATASGRDGQLLAFGTSAGRRGLWLVATDVGSELLGGAPALTPLRGPCASGRVPTALALSGGDGEAPDLAVCDGLLRLLDDDGAWSDAGRADGAAWPGG